MFAPVQDIMSQLLGSSATEIGLMWGDFFRVRRLKNALRLFEDVKRLAEEHGFTLKPVAPRLLLPILESASLLDDVDLNQRWAALLTNAARTDYDGSVLPAFPEILNQLTPEEARFLDEVYEESVASDSGKVRSDSAFHDEEGFWRISAKALASVHPVLIDDLERLRLVTRTGVAISINDELVNKMPPANHLYLSNLGKVFIRACRVED